MAEIYSTIILSAVILNEIGGSISTRLLLRLVKEEGKAYPPVFGFIDKDSILLGLEAEDKWEAITKLVHQLCIKKGIDFSQEGRLLEGVIERELSMTTGIGKALAIPHGPLDNIANKIMGIFAICHKGIDFGSMDGKPVHFIILSLIPKDRMEDHLKYLIEISRIFSKPFIYSALMEARTEEEVLRILQEAQEE
jgi:PTS system nitrogen regulatory IIA component